MTFLGNRSIIRVCESAKLALKSLRKDKTIIVISDFAVQDVDTIPSPCHLDRVERVKPRGTKAKGVGQKTSKTLASQKVLEIQLGTEALPISKHKTSRSGDTGEKMSLKGMITLAKCVSKEEVSSIQTTLNALHIIENLPLRSVMEEHFAEIVIKLPQHTAITKRNNA